MIESESENLPFKDISEPTQKITGGQFSEIKELENQGYIIKSISDTNIEEFLKQLEGDLSVLENPLEKAKVIKDETDLLDNSDGGIAEMIPPHQLTIAGSSEEDHRIIMVMKKVEGKDFRGADELFGTSEGSAVLQKQFQELIEASLVVFDGSAERGDLCIPDIIQVYKDTDASAGFKNIMVGKVEGTDRKVWLVDTFPLLRMHNEVEAFMMLHSFKKAISEFDDTVYEGWFKDSRDLLKSRLSDAEFRGEVSAHGKSISWLQGDDLESLDDNSLDYLIYDFFKTKYWGKGATEWDGIKRAMEESVDRRILAVNERLEKSYREEASEEFRGKSRFDVKSIQISPEAQRQFLPKIWESGKFFIPVSISNLKSALENGINVKDAEVCLTLTDKVFTETPYFLKLEQGFTSASQEDAICYLAFTSHSLRGEMSDVPYGCKIQEKNGTAFIKENSGSKVYKGRGEHSIPSYGISAVVVGNPDVFTKTTHEVLDSKLAFIPVFELVHRE